ncbi:MAG: 5-oxoprolinase subunit PxpB [Haliscomenobacteraceae bacterium CHB4]|nr:Kinase A inhibitor [Saprospiraceae bacterium]MCE7925350.1 5-oxoprolinase subunit PxpB [Haliscomenobacteraceae bacterium CHB4]
MSSLPDIAICSESAVAVTYGDRIDPEIHQKVLAFNDRLLNDPFPGLQAVVPAYASVTVFFDPVVVKENWPRETSSAHVVRALLEDRLIQSPIRNPQSAIPNPQSPIIEIPMQYDGPDLAGVAGKLQLSENEVVRLHSGTVYTVFMIGFLPGFPYLGPLPEALRLPRRDTPRLRVPAGSVAIAGDQTGIYPQASPGGWHLIGHTDSRLFDPKERPPARLQPGMRVRFVEI